jgi:hypothetical protein
MQSCVIYDTDVSVPETLVAMDKDLIKFRGGPNLAFQERVHVSLSPTNVISLNQHAFSLLGRPKMVHLYYSRSREMIAIEPANDDRLGLAFPVLSRGSSTMRINAASFCRHFGSRLNTTLRFIAPDFRDGKLQLKLDETVSVATPARKRKKD